MKFAQEVLASRWTVGKARIDVHSLRFKPAHFSLGETDMKTSVMSVCATAAVVLFSAFAGTRTSPRLHPDSLARIEAISSYCGKVDPGSRPLYESKLVDLTRSHSAEEIAVDRDSNKYRQAMMEANETLARASATTAINGCQEFLAQK